MAERVASGNYDQLHHFIADGVWDAAPLESELLNQADRLVGGKGAVLAVVIPGRSQSERARNPEVVERDSGFAPDARPE